jgi:hypothetical protein
MPMILHITFKENEMSDVVTLEHELNQMILSGKAMEAFEKFYADDVIMQWLRDAGETMKS